MGRVVYKNVTSVSNLWSEINHQAFTNSAMSESTYNILGRLVRPPTYDPLVSRITDTSGIRRWRLVHPGRPYNPLRRNRAPLRADSPPPERLGDELDFERFCVHFPGTTDEPYVHVPDRRLQREEGSPSFNRTCLTCHKLLLPYVRGRCPNCWHLRFSFGLRSSELCTCVCLCPPEPDDELDDDYNPEEWESDEEIDLSEVPVTNNNNSRPALLADTILYDRDGNIVHRPLYEETLDHFADAVDPQDPADEASSLLNQSNTEDVYLPARLIRAPFRIEILHMLEMGYSRDQLRERFEELRDEGLTSFIPPDYVNWPQAPAVCWQCRREFSIELRNALTMGLVRLELDWILRNIPVRGVRTEEELLALANAIYIREAVIREGETVWSRMRRVEYAHFCPHCRLPQYRPGTFQRGPTNCLCHCDCVHPSHILVARTDSQSSDENDVLPSPIRERPRPHFAPANLDVEDEDMMDEM